MFVKKLDKKKMYMIFGIVILIIAIAGSAYAYYSATASAKISGTAGGGNLTINVEKLSTSATGSLVPMDNDTTTLNKAILGEGNTSGSFDNTKACIDKNGYTACQIYKITISNTSSVPIVLNGGVSLSGDNTPNIECAVMNNTNTLSSNTSCKNSKSLANKFSLGANTTEDYYIIVYIKNIDGVQTDTGDFTGTITFISSDGAEIKARFENAPAYNTLIKLGLSEDTSHTPDFTTVSGNSGVEYDTVDKQIATGLGDGTNGIYEAEDDLGTSYYFRGNIDNNYVYFAKNWWQIIRINGDGTIRMIYTGNPNDSYADQNISLSYYNQNYNDNAYVGYMYGNFTTPTNCSTDFNTWITTCTGGSTSYEEAHANINNSTIKRVIDTWYKTDIVDKGYSSYVADAIYCNDREVVQINNDGGVTITSNGAGANVSAYASFKRNFIEHNPILKCKNKNDRFTKSNTLGNGALTYPVALITTDEVIMGGGTVIDLATMTYIANDNYYLHSEDRYWTMTPISTNQFGAAFVGVVDVNHGGSFVYHKVVNDNLGSDGPANADRPVISLKSNAITGGDGTVGNPFYVNEKPTI